ncbi:MAG: hypothetical protein Q9187_008132 [Circinaria calcarea]
MSLSRPTRCLFAAIPTPLRPLPKRRLHSSPTNNAKHTPKHASLKASDMGLVKNEDPTSIHKPYSQTEKAALSKKYTPAQIAAIEAGEAAISPDDLANQGAIRSDPMSLKYLDDLSTIRPVIDKPIRAPETNYDPDLRFKTEDELAADMVKWVQDLPDDADRVEWMKFVDNTRLTVGKEEAELNPRSALAPEIPKLKIPGMRFNATVDSDSEENDPGIQRLMKQSGFTAQQIRRFRVKNLVMHRVVNQTRMGKVQSQYFLTVAGNGKGLLGIGEGKSVETEDARKQATMAAIRNMRPIPRYEERTIFGDVTGKVGATELVLMTRPPGK